MSKQTAADQTPDPTPERPSGVRDFDDLFRAEHTAMIQVAVLLVGSRAIAEEVVQEGFSAVLQRWDVIERPGAYLRTVVVNACRMELRRRETQQRLDPPISALPVDTPGELVELHAAISGLPERQRCVVVLRYLRDLPDAEIAELLDCRASTVRSLAHRGLKHLRKDLA